MLHCSQFIKSTVTLLATVFAFTVFSHKVEAETIFEGYYKVGLSGTHSGYVIQRYEFDAKKKEFAGSYFAYVRLSPDGKQYLNESLVAKSDEAFHPIKYNYSKLSNELDPAKPGKIRPLVTTIDATFKKTKDGKNLQATMTGIKDGKNFSAKPIMDKNMFLSNFLLYLMLQKGLTAGRNFAFEAVAEESGEVQKGQVQIKSEEKFRNIASFKIDWTYKETRSISFIATTGEALATESTTQGVTQELVASKELATAGFTFPEKSVKGVFGNIPEGKINAVYKESQKPAVAPVTLPANGKKVESLNTATPSESAPSKKTKEDEKQ